MQRRQNTYVLTYVCARPAGDPLSVPGPLHAAERVAEALCHHLLDGDALGGDPTAGAQTVARVPPRGFRLLPAGARPGAAHPAAPEPHHRALGGAQVLSRPVDAPAP